MAEEFPLLDPEKTSFSGLSKILPPLFKPGVERLMGARQLNELYEKVKGKTSSADEFAAAVLEALEMDYHIPEEDIAPLREIEGPMVLVGNLPVGGVEALIMMRILSKIRPDFRLIADNLMGRIKELQDHIIVVDPFSSENGKPDNESAERPEVFKYLRSGGLVGVFPAGENPEYDDGTGGFSDPSWDTNIARIIQLTGATVVPVYFHGNNSLLVQVAGLIHPKLKQKLRIRDFTKKTSRELRFKIGKKIPPGRIASIEKPEQLIQYLRGKTFLLSTKFMGEEMDFNLIRLRKPETHKPIAPEPDYDEISAEVKKLLPERILAERDKFIVFSFVKDEAPALMHEIGRQREITFREVGEGSGKAVDTDAYDEYYTQLVLWDIEENRVAGGYRIGKIDRILELYGRRGIYCNSLFRIRPKLWKEIGKALEMGRSYVGAEYQRSFLPLMLLWTAIGSYVKKHPEYKTLLGPVSITAELNPVSRHLLVSFLEEKEMDEELENLVKPRNKFQKKEEIIRNYYNSIAIHDLSDVQDLISGIEDSNQGVPVLLKHYLKLGGKLLAFNIDNDFSNVLDGLIMVDLTQTEPRLLKKYMGSEGAEEFLKYHGKEA